ncbi:hypothetical protein [Demequina globuliformis]|nr:hypothetical protein [Demequina globuliformis]
MWTVCKCGVVVGDAAAHATFHDAHPMPTPEPPVDPDPEPEPTEETP